MTSLTAYFSRADIRSVLESLKSHNRYKGARVYITKLHNKKLRRHGDKINGIKIQVINGGLKSNILHLK